MDALSVSPVGPAALSALSALRPVQASRIQATQAGNPSGSAALSAQSLVQSLFQRTLQTTSLYPVSEPVTGSAALAQEATASLLAALTPPQAPANVTPAPDATTNPAALQASSSDSSTAPPTLPAVQDLPTAQDAFETSLSPDFAMQTALRFGAGVGAQAAASGIVAPDLGTGLVRDAATVLRLENLQPRTGGPGPEAFARPETPAQRVLRTYETGSAVSATQGTSSVDLLA
jgi:hypothetical protein